MTQLLAPNGKPSNLTPEQYKLVRTPAFKKWFGDWENLILTKLNDSGIDEVSLKRLEDGVSKVVDENGEPLVCYHSSKKEFNIFEKEKISENFDYSFGFHFSNDIEDSNVYGEITKSFFLKIINPFIFNVKNKTNGSVFIDLNRYEAIHEIVKSRKSEIEIDGVIAYSVINGYVTMYSNQIKLADGTNTKFDDNNPDIRFDEGGSVIINPTEIECHNCHWKWKVKDGGDDLFICHKCYTDNTKYYKFEGLKGEKILDTNTYEKGGQLLNLNQIRKGQYEAKSDEIEIHLTNPKILNGIGTNKWQLIVLYGNDSVINEWFETKNEALKTGAILLNDFLNSNFKKGGRTISQTPAPKKDQIKGSDKNKEGSAKDISSAKKIKFSDELIERIKNKVDSHNKKYPNKKITIESAKAVVRRGMGAYSSTHRPTISGGNENSRVAWGLARLNAFLYKIVNGKSKSGKYSQDNDLIEELGYNVEKYEIGGIFQGTPHDFDKYSTEYIGTGEGLQVFGWGLYFTDIKDIAKNYAKNEMLIEKEISRKSDDFGLLVIYTNISDSVVDKLGYLKIKLKEFEALKNEYKIDTWDDKIEKYSNLIDIIKNYKGKIYSVTLFKGEKESDYDLIQWEKPLGIDDLVKIFDEAEKIGGIDFKDGWELDEKYGLTNERGNKVTGEEMYRWLSIQLGGDKEASLFLLRAGIDGIKYKAGTLSGMSDAEGYNYVIFDANDVTIENKEKYANGGDIQAYKEAMGISEFKEGGEAKPKKVYVSIRLANDYERISGNLHLFKKYKDESFQELKNQKLVGVRGVSLTKDNVADWFANRDCLIVMKYDEFIQINDTTEIKYDDPYQLMANDLKIFSRLYGNSDYSDKKEKDITRRSNLGKILEKIPFYFDKAKYQYLYEDAQKRDELQRYYYILADYKHNFIAWITDNEYIINSPNDLTERLIEFAHLPNSESGIDNYRNFNLEKYVLTTEDLLPIIIQGLKKAGSTYFDEKEVLINDKILNIPTNSQIFFKKSSFENSNLQEVIDRYNLKENYKLYSVDSKRLNDLQVKVIGDRSKIFMNKFEFGKEQLEIKKELVLNDLQKLFLDKSLDKINKILDEKYPSTYYFDWEGEETKYYRWNEVIEVQFLLNKFFDITLREWKSFFRTKRANEIYSMSFYGIYNTIDLFLREFIEQNRDYLENINKYHNENGDYLWLYDIERAVLGVVGTTWDEGNGISDKQLAKKYFQMIGAELTTYYSKDELVIPSIYKEGGEADEPTHFWGTEAGGVLVYCSTTNRYLILLRSEWVLEPNTWGIISGKLDDEENVQEAVMREAEEEIGRKLGRLIPSFIFEKPNFKFHNFVSIVEEEFTPELNWENSDYRWVKLDEMPENLHFGLKLLLQKEDLPKLVKKNKMENEILIVDINMYHYNTSVNFKNKEIPLKLNPPKNEVQFIEWAEGNNFEFEQWGDVEMQDASWGYTFEIPLFKYIEYMKTEKFYTGGELKKGIKTEMEHKDTIKKIKTGDYNIKESAELIAKDHLEENDNYYTHLLKMEKQFGEGGLTAKKEDFNVPNTESLIELVYKEREKKIKEWKRLGEKVVVGRNDGYWWLLPNERDVMTYFAKNPSKIKIQQIIKEYPNVTEIHFSGSIKSSERVGFEMEIIDDFDVLLWSKEDNFFKKGLTFEYIQDKGKYKNTIIDKSETIEYKDREGSGDFLYYKSIDKYGNIGESRIYRDVLQEDFDNGKAIFVDKMEEGGKVESIYSSKGDIKLNLEENWYSDDTDVELVPVSELIKFREFDRKVNPKYNKENSVDNINHLKFMFQKDGVKSPLIIEYSKEDNAVLIIEGNHRLNSAIDLGMEYLPARVVLKKYGKYSPEKLKNAMKVSGVKGDQFGYVPSNMKPSKVGIQGTKSLVFADGGIIEGRLHSECDAEEGCGRKFQVGENGHIIEAERDEAVIVADAFESNEELTIKGTPSEVASALNVIGGGKNFDKGATIIKNGSELEIPELKNQATNTDVEDVIDSGSIIINRRSMADEKEYKVTGTPKQIASAINSINGNGVVIEQGAEIKEN
jgi:8-oxo-dGTP pyrophosphatase MutT (NUDIX family)